MSISPVVSGGQTRINTTTSNNQGQSHTVGLKNGSYVVVWGSYGADGGGMGVYGQRMDANGYKLGGEFRINTYTTNDQENPRVAALEDGGFVVVWESYGQDGSSEGIYGQMFLAGGSANGPEFRVNATTLNDQGYPDVAGLKGGGFVVTYHTADNSNVTDVSAVVYGANGVVTEPEFQMNSIVDSYQSYTSVTGTSGGGFMATWVSFMTDGSGNGVYGKFFSPTGLPLSGEMLINTHTTSHQESIDTTTLKNGRVVVVWHDTSGHDGDSYGIYAQMFNPDGTAYGAEMPINSYTTSSQLFPAVTALADGGFVVTWSSNGQDGNSYGIYGQHYDAKGRMLGDEFHISSTTVGGQNYPSVAALPDGGFVVTWTSANDGSGTGIDSQRFTGQVIGTNQADTLNDPLGANWMNGQNGADILQGGTGNDTIYGEGGDDTLRGGAGNDWMLGGNGNDSMIGGSGSDSMNGGDGNDDMSGGSGGDYIRGGSGNDDINGGDGEDSLYGENGNDNLFGGVGVDELYGDSGDDRLFGNQDDDWLYGGGGNDVLNGGSGNDTMNGDGGDDTMYGNDGNDNMHGGSGGDDLFGGLGNDELFGGGGDDELRGNEGDDLLFGGDGADIFHFRTGDGNDRIRQFQDGLDVIHIISGAADFDDLTITDRGAHAEISFADVTILLRSFDHNLLTDADFSFV